MDRDIQPRERAMQTYRYLVVGSGMTGHAAAKAIREIDRGGSLGMIGDDPMHPYLRPPLTKGLWSGKPRETVFLPQVEGLALHAERRAVELDTRAKALRDDRGEEYRYEKLLLATGGRPRRLPDDGGRVIYFRTLADYDRLRAVQGPEVVVIGGGFIGSELAASLASVGKRVTMVLRDERIGAKVYPPALSRFVTRYFEDRGVRVLAGASIASVRPDGGRTLVEVTGGHRILADAVVAGLGVTPDTALAERAGIAVQDGIEVDDAFRTSARDVWAAGDVARFSSAALGERIRVEHEDAALSMGREAGRSMAGAAVSYRQLPFFYSDLFDLGYEAVGILDSRLETVESWKTEGRDGVVYYLQGGRVRGVLLWGRFGHVDAARELIARQAALPRDELVRAIT
jgi:NADPH-dependent 2,4-dienoyl-CoA reductase/sulfur reductase-like enzyme